MNTIVLWFIDRVMFLTMWIFIGDKVKLEEVKKRRYNNDKGYTTKINNWDSATFLNEQAQNRANLLQSKLSSLLSILSILVGLYSITGAITNNFPVLIQITCLLLAFLGLVYAIGPLTITTIHVVDLDKYVDTNNFNKDVQNEFQKSITDLGCRSDFHADCLKIAKSTIFISMIFYIVGILIGLFPFSKLQTTENSIPCSSKVITTNNTSSSFNAIDTFTNISKPAKNDTLKQMPEALPVCSSSIPMVKTQTIKKSPQKKDKKENAATRKH